MSLKERLLLLGDLEVAWTGGTCEKQYLAYFCSFANTNAHGGIAIHEFDLDGNHLSTIILPVEKLDRRDPVSDIEKRIEVWVNALNTFQYGPIATFEFEVKLQSGETISLLRNSEGDGVLMPREVRFEQARSGRVAFDFELFVWRTSKTDGDTQRF